jgi:hypothetical protein
MKSNFGPRVRSPKFGVVRFLGVSFWLTCSLTMALVQSTSAGTEPAEPPTAFLAAKVAMPDNEGTMVEFTVGEFAQTFRDDGHGHNPGMTIRWTKIAEGDWAGAIYDRAQTKADVAVEFAAAPSGRAVVKAVGAGDLSLRGEAAKQAFGVQAYLIAMWQRYHRWSQMNQSPESGEVVWQEDAETLSFTAKPPQYYEITYDFRSQKFRKVLSDEKDRPIVKERELTARENSDLKLFLRSLKLPKMMNQPMLPPGRVSWFDLKTKTEIRHLARRANGTYWQFSAEQANELKTLFIQLIPDSQWEKPTKTDRWR